MKLSFLFIVFALGFDFSRAADPLLDSSCDTYFQKQYINSHNCLLEAKSMDCFMIGGSSTLGTSVIGVHAGATFGKKIGEYAAKSFQASMSQLPSVTQQQVLKAFEVFKTEVALQEKAIQEFKKVQNQLAREITDGRHTTLKSLQTSAYNSGKSPFRPDLKLALFESTFAQKWQSHIAQEKDPQLKLKLQEINSNGKRIVSPQAVGENLKQKISEIFPNEYRQLKPYYEKLQSYQLEKEKLLNSPQTPEVVNKILDLSNKELTDRYIFENLLNTNENSKLRLVHEFIERGTSSLEKSYYLELQSKSEKIVGKEKLENSQREIERSQKKLTTTGAQVGAVIGGGAAMVSMELLAQDQGQIDIRSCQKNYDLSEDEIEFLGNGKLLSPAQAIKSQGILGSCESLVLTNPEQTVQQALDRYGGIPKGLCHILKNESVQLDILIGDTSAPTQINCQKITAADYQVDTSTERPQISIQDTDHSYDISTLDYAGNYIDIRSIKVTDTKRKEEDRRLKNQIQTGYSFLHSKEFATRPDLADTSLNCSQQQNHEGIRKFCSLRPKIFASRVSMQMQKSVCALNGKKSSYKRNDLTGSK